MLIVWFSLIVGSRTFYAIQIYKMLGSNKDWPCWKEMILFQNITFFDKFNFQTWDKTKTKWMEEEEELAAQG
jgi:hypothetical protein